MLPDMKLARKKIFNLVMESDVRNSNSAVC